MTVPVLGGTKSVRSKARSRACSAATLLGAAVLAGCGPAATDSVAGQAQARAGYVSQDGTIQQVALVKRSAPLELSGTTLTGRPWTLAQDRGKVVVLNVWGSWCPPCVAEAPDLQRAWKQLAPKGRSSEVAFMGIDIRESGANGAAFLRSVGITYPSLSDEGSQTLLALRGAVSDPPTTLVLDPQGRVAARVLGRVTTDTLTGLVHDVRREPA